MEKYEKEPCWSQRVPVLGLEQFLYEGPGREKGRWSLYALVIVFNRRLKIQTNVG